MQSKMRFTVFLLIIAWLFVSSALSQDGLGDNSMQGDSYDRDGSLASDSGQGYDGGQNYNADQSYDSGISGDNAEYYMDEEPAESEGLADLGPADDSNACPPGVFCYISPGQSQCSIWITDKSGAKKQETMKIPLKKWARLELRTCSEGNLAIYEKMPNGDVINYDRGPASANRKYRMWFYADSPGTHTIWFKIGGKKSNEIKFSVGSGSSGNKPPIGGTSNGGTIDGGSSNGGTSGSGCSVRTDKNAYGVGEKVIIYYSVSFPCTVQLILKRPDGIASTFGPMDLSPGTYSQAGKASEPFGKRTVTLEAVSLSKRCIKTCTFTVGSLPLNDQAEVYSQENLEVNGEYQSTEDGSEAQDDYSTYGQDQESSDGQNVEERISI